MNLFLNNLFEDEPFVELGTAVAFHRKWSAFFIKQRAEAEPLKRVKVFGV
jgi:hypothetical protein